MKIFKKAFLISLFVLLVSCAVSNVPPQSLNAFLYNKASMTEQLKHLDKDFKVILLYSGMEGSNFKRISSLNLSGKPVLVGLSLAKTGSPYFVDLLKNADTTPIGKILFAKDSGVSRDPNMEVEQVYLNYISDSTAKAYISSLGYTNSDVIYKRTSIFRKGEESMQLIEYILPSIHNWIKTPAKL